jgi:hypothetical protein
MASSSSSGAGTASRPSTEPAPARNIRQVADPIGRSTVSSSARSVIASTAWNRRPGSLLTVIGLPSPPRVLSRAAMAERRGSADGLAHASASAMTPNGPGALHAGPAGLAGLGFWRARTALAPSPGSASPESSPSPGVRAAAVPGAGPDRDDRAGRDAAPRTRTVEYRCHHHRARCLRTSGRPCPGGTPAAGRGRIVSMTGQGRQGTRLGPFGAQEILLVLVLGHARWPGLEVM